MGSAARDHDLASALGAVVGDARTREDLNGALEELLARTPPDLVDATGPLSWLADRGAALDQLLELGQARLTTEFDVSAAGRSE